LLLHKSKIKSGLNLKEDVKSTLLSLQQPNARVREGR